MTDIARENSAIVESLYFAVHRVSAHLFGGKNGGADVCKQSDPTCLMEELNEQQLTLRRTLDELSKISSMLGV